MKLSGREWEGEAGWGAGSPTGAAGVIVSEGQGSSLSVVVGWDCGRGGGRRRRVGSLGGIRLPRN